MIKSLLVQPNKYYFYFLFSIGTPNIHKERYKI